MVDGVEFFHKNSYGMRDLKDDNILIRRRENNVFEIALCDFGMSCYLNKNNSLNYLTCNSFRDPTFTDKNYKKGSIYLALYDIYSLGRLL